jgi:hypothetical protein
MPTVTFTPIQSWIASVKSGYIYRIDYPIFDVNDLEHRHYVASRHNIFGMAPLDLGRFDTYDEAAKVCVDHAEANLTESVAFEPPHIHPHPHEHPHEHQH